MKTVILQSLVILLIASILLCMDRMYRIEGFLSSMQNEKACGVDLPSCSEGTKCMNGFCVEPRAKPLPKYTGLPVFP